MKTEVVRVRLTEQEKNLLQERSQKLNMSMSDYIKYCCLVNPPIASENTGKRVLTTMVDIVKSTDMSKLNYADTIASLKEHSLKTKKHIEKLKKNEKGN